MQRVFYWTRFLPSSVVLRLSTLGPIGYWGKAPGTNGSIAGLCLYVVLFYHLPLFEYLITALFWVFIAIGICGEAEVRMQKLDPSEVVLDEFVAVPICFLAFPIQDTSQPWLWAFLGFAFFRFFDIVKPGPINNFQNFSHGYGVVLDDVGAALASCVCLHIFYLFMP